RCFGHRRVSYLKLTANSIGVLQSHCEKQWLNGTKRVGHCNISNQRQCTVAAWVSVRSRQLWEWLLVKKVAVDEREWLLEYGFASNVSSAAIAANDGRSVEILSQS
ncbi:Hypothetical predicted protein, partial [Olea europaea subsp. europaea]